MHKEIQGVRFSNNLLKKKKLNKEKKCGATTSPSLGNIAARVQLVDRALSKSKNNKNVMEFDSISNIKSKDYVLKDKKKSPSRVLKILGATGLAVFMGVGTLLGVLIVPMNSANAGALNGVANTQSGLGSEGLNGGAGLSSGGAGGCGYGDNGAGGGEYGGAANGGDAVVLDPESDETIFTTESGFEIKSHNVAGQTLANSKVQYFTLGSYNGTSLNWIILATSTTLAETSTDAGIAINNAGSKGLVSMMTTSNLSANQMLVISEKVIPIATYKFSVTTRSSKTGTLPSASSTGSGWYAERNGNSNAQYYATKVVDGLEDYYSAYTGNYSSHSATINGWFTGSSLGLSSYCGNKIVKNSNFNGSYYGFALTNSQASTYLPTSLRTAKDTSGTTRAYWCGDNISHSITYSVSSDYTYTKEPHGSGLNSYKYYYWGTGTGSCKWTGYYISTSGSLTSNFATTTGTISHASSTSFYFSYDIGYIQVEYVYHPQATFTSSGTTSLTAYYRPAMVVDLSKF